MKVKFKLLVLLAIFLLSFNGSCLKKIFSGGGCPAGMCCPGCTPGSRYSVIFQNSCPNLQGLECFAGSLRYHQCLGGCGGVRQENRFPFGFNASPSSADLNNPPSSITLTGQSIDATYGPPRVDYHNQDGYLIGSAYATSVAGDGSWLVAPLPDLSQAYSGTFTIEVVNADWEGYYVNFMGSATVSCWGRDRPDSDGDGWYDDEDCYPSDPNLWFCSGGDGGGGGGGECGDGPCPIEYAY